MTTIINLINLIAILFGLSIFMLFSKKLIFKIFPLIGCMIYTYFKFMPNALALNYYSIAHWICIAGGILNIIILELPQKNIE